MSQTTAIAVVPDAGGQFYVGFKAAFEELLAATVTAKDAADQLRRVADVASAAVSTRGPIPTRFAVFTYFG